MSRQYMTKARKLALAQAMNAAEPQGSLTITTASSLDTKNNSKKACCSSSKASKGKNTHAKCSTNTIKRLAKKKSIVIGTNESFLEDLKVCINDTNITSASNICRWAVKEKANEIRYRNKNSAPSFTAV